MRSQLLQKLHTLPPLWRLATQIGGGQLKVDPLLPKSKPEATGKEGVVSSLKPPIQLPAAIRKETPCNKKADMVR